MISARKFIQLARQGRHRGASSGERVAHRLAKALHEIGDDLALLDHDTVEGFCMLTKAANGPWQTDASKSEVFNLIALAAGK